MKRKFFEIAGKLLPTKVAIKYLHFNAERIRKYRSCLTPKEEFGRFVIADLKAKLDQSVYVKGMKIEDCAYIEGYKSHIRELIGMVDSDEYLNQILTIKKEIEDYERTTNAASTGSTPTTNFTINNGSSR